MRYDEFITKTYCAEDEKRVESMIETIAKNVFPGQKHQDIYDHHSYPLFEALKAGDFPDVLKKCGFSKQQPKLIDYLQVFLKARITARSPDYRFLSSNEASAPNGNVCLDLDESLARYFTTRQGAKSLLPDLSDAEYKQAISRFEKALREWVVSHWIAQKREQRSPYLALFVGYEALVLYYYHRLEETEEEVDIAVLDGFFWLDEFYSAVCDILLKACFDRTAQRGKDDEPTVGPPRTQEMPKVGHLNTLKDLLAAIEHQAIPLRERAYLSLFSKVLHLQDGDKEPDGIDQSEKRERVLGYLESSLDSWHPTDPAVDVRACIRRGLAGFRDYANTASPEDLCSSLRGAARSDFLSRKARLWGRDFTDWIAGLWTALNQPDADPGPVIALLLQCLPPPDGSARFTHRYINALVVALRQWETPIITEIHSQATHSLPYKVFRKVLAVLDAAAPTQTQALSPASEKP